MTWKTIENIDCVITKISLVLALLMFLLASGCSETTKQPVWGQGELPADYVALFGDSNTARLNKAQNDLLNKHEVVIHGLDTKDGHVNGLIDYYNMLSNRVSVLEAVDPNEISDINARLDKLETVVTDELVAHGDLLIETWKKMNDKNPVEIAPLYGHGHDNRTECSEQCDVTAKINEIIDRLNK